MSHMEADSKTKISRYISYLLRHNPQDLKMDVQGFVDMDELLEKVGRQYQVDKKSVEQIVERSDRKRFEIKGNRIRALYGHSIPLQLKFEEDRVVKLLYHGTTRDAACRILKTGIKPMKRTWVHLSPTIGIAREVGLRRTKNPVVLEIDAEAAGKGGARFYRATDKIYLCVSVPPKYVRIAHTAEDA